MDDILLAREMIRSAQRLVIFTGAGVSADSGVPTFRGASGDTFWGKYDPMTLASPQGFRRDPKLVYDWYNWRRSQLAVLTPNAGHVAIGALQERGATLITQNVDGLHERIAPKNAVTLQLHGTLAEDRCSGCDYREAVDFTALPPLRGCPECGAKLRPAVVWFGEMLDPALWKVAEHACKEADAMLVVGTSGQVYPAAGLVQLAAQRGRVIVFNLEDSALDEHAAISLKGRASEILPLLVS